MRPERHHDPAVTAHRVRQDPRPCPQLWIELNPQRAPSPHRRIHARLCSANPHPTAAHRQTPSGYTQKKGGPGPADHPTKRPTRPDPHTHAPKKGVEEQSEDRSPTPPFQVKCRRRPTLPHPPRCSTIGAGRLSFRVRKGTGRDPTAKTTDKTHETTHTQPPQWPVCRAIPDTAQWTQTRFTSTQPSKTLLM